MKDPFLKALAQREEANRSGKMTVIIGKLAVSSYFIVKVMTNLRQ